MGALVLDPTRGKMGILGPTTIVVMSGFVAKLADNGGRKTVWEGLREVLREFPRPVPLLLPFALAGILRLSLGATSVLGCNLALARAL